MTAPDCPLLLANSSTSVGAVQGVEETGFEPDAHGGSGTRYCRCLVCGKPFSVTEDMGGHVPQYTWPRECRQQ